MNARRGASGITATVYAIFVLVLVVMTAVAVVSYQTGTAAGKKASCPAVSR